MRVLVDTNALIWATDEETRLSTPATSCLKHPATRWMVSAAAFWEMTIKVGLGKLDLGMEPWRLMTALTSRGSIQLAGIEAAHLRRLEALPRHHGDPFDRLMIAQALEEGWKVVSSDAQWDAYGVTRIW